MGRRTEEHGEEQGGIRYSEENRKRDTVEKRRWRWRKEEEQEEKRRGGADRKVNVLN